MDDGVEKPGAKRDSLTEALLAEASDDKGARHGTLLYLEALECALD